MPPIGRSSERRWSRIGLRHAMGAIALVGLLLSVVANDRWRLVFPRRLPFNRTNAVARLAIAARSDLRKYDRSDVERLLEFVAEGQLFVGKTRAEIAASIGPIEKWKGEHHPTPHISYRIVGLPAESPICFVLLFVFDDRGLCYMVQVYPPSL